MCKNGNSFSENFDKSGHFVSLLPAYDHWQWLFNKTILTKVFPVLHRRQHFSSHSTRGSLARLGSSSRIEGMATWFLQRSWSCWERCEKFGSLISSCPRRRCSRQPPSCCPWTASSCRWRARVYPGLSGAELSHFRCAISARWSSSSSCVRTLLLNCVEHLCSAFGCTDCVETCQSSWY